MTNEEKLAREMRETAASAQATATEIALLARNLRTAAELAATVRLRADWSAGLLAAYAEQLEGLERFRKSVVSSNAVLRALLDNLERIEAEQGR